MNKLEDPDDLSDPEDKRSKSSGMVGNVVTRFASRLVLILILAYVIVLLIITVRQRQMIYLPSPERGSPVARGMAGAVERAIVTPDGHTLSAWYQQPASGKALFLVFHGNGGSLPTLTGLLTRLSSDGSGFLAIDYRGYGGSTGHPSEIGLLRDGDAAYADARQLGFDPSHIVVLGESLGSNIAVSVAATHPVRALILDSSFSSAVDIAAAKWWMFPVKLLMFDTFDTARMIGRVTVPTLFIHGVLDDQIAISFARTLFDDAKAPKTFIAVADAGHLALWRPDVMMQMKDWLAKQK